MKIYKTQKEVEKDIKDGVLDCKNEDVTFECGIDIDADIVNARNIKANNIISGDINAWDINAWDINADDIKARNINAEDIKARNISYNAFCNVYKGIQCASIKSTRYNASKPICLDGELEIIKPEDEEVEKAIKLLEEKGRLVDGKILKQD